MASSSIIEPRTSSPDTRGALIMLYGTFVEPSINAWAQCRNWVCVGLESVETPGVNPFSYGSCTYWVIQSSYLLGLVTYSQLNSELLLYCILGTKWVMRRKKIIIPNLHLKYSVKSISSFLHRTASNQIHTMRYSWCLWHCSTLKSAGGTLIKTVETKQSRKWSGIF